MVKILFQHCMHWWHRHFGYDVPLPAETQNKHIHKCRRYMEDGRRLLKLMQKYVDETPKERLRQDASKEVKKMYAESEAFSRYLDHCHSITKQDMVQFYRSLRDHTHHCRNYYSFLHQNTGPSEGKRHDLFL